MYPPFPEEIQGMDDLPPEILAILEMPGDDSASVFVGDNEMDMFGGHFPMSAFEMGHLDQYQSENGQPDDSMDTHLHTHSSAPVSHSYTSQQPPGAPSGVSVPQNYNIQSSVNINPNFPPPPSQQVQSSTELINQLLQLQMKQDAQLRTLREQQTRFFASPSQDLYSALFKEESDLKNQLDQELAHLLVLLQQVLLTPGELHRVDYLRNEFQLQATQVELYLSELDTFVNRRVLTKPTASLEIVRQPFPNVPSKQSQLQDDQLVLQLLTGASVKVVNSSPIKATVLMESTPGKGNDHKMIENDTQLLEHSHLLAKFPITFLEGTRKTAAYLRFGTEVQFEQGGQILSCKLETERNSSPFVVMTNQKQWEACERTLLFRDAFAGQLEITWNYFANALQRQFIRATKQDPQNPTRCLSRFDFGYLHAKFLGKRTSIHQKEYDNYWNWYGKCVQVIRYQRHISQLWQAGLMYGFMTREEVDMALSEEPPGTFVLRFSERHPGQFGIAYVGSQRNQIKHYLVQPNDTAAAKFTLPDFLRDKPQFIHMLQFTLLPSGTPQFRRLPKDQALQPYYSKRIGGDTSGSGYDPLN